MSDADPPDGPQTDPELLVECERLYLALGVALGKLAEHGEQPAETHLESVVPFVRALVQLARQRPAPAMELLARVREEMKQEAEILATERSKYGAH